MNDESSIAARPAPDAVRSQWPKAKDVGRLQDMGPGHMRVGLDGDSDVYVEVCDGKRSASVEFCTVGNGGGKSGRTREALIALMVAMEADNAESPGADWWAQRASPPEREAQQAGEQG
jgi:hypothetical protein